MRLTKETLLNVPAKFAFEWFAQPDSLKRLLPPWENIRIIQQSSGNENRVHVELSLPLFAGLRTKWFTEHCADRLSHVIEQTQLQGPFESWQRKVRVETISESSCKLIDEIDYQFAYGKPGDWLANACSRRLQAVLEYQHREAKTEIELHNRYREKKRLRILISGSSGIIGSSLCSFLRTGGHEVVRLVRNEEQAEQDSQTIFWDPLQGEVERNSLESFDAVIHLGGANIAHHKWTANYKQLIRQSRIRSTKVLAALLSTLREKPSVFIVASAIGYYGDRGDETMTEESAPGSGFLPELVREWEQSAEFARQAGIRVIHPRIGVVLTPAGAALGSMLPLFRFGLSGAAGNGKQYWSTVSIHDVVGAIHFMLFHESLSGPVNLVMPEPVTNRQFTQTLGQVLNRPTIFPMPAPLIKLFLGEMGEALLLESTRVVPEKLLAAGYQFQQETVEDTFRHLLGRY